MWRRARAAGGTEAGDRTEAIVAEISAQEVGGQIAVGSHNLQINADHGAIVHVAGPGQAPAVRERPLPVMLQPRDFPGLLGRERELTEVRTLLAESTTVALTAPSGGGKTSLLRRLSHVAETTLEHGVVFLRAAGWPREDVERFLFDAFYESDAPFQPTPFELRRRLADRRALVVLDDVEQERDDVRELLDCVPACRFLLASERRALWGEERTLELGGLVDDAALELFERELGRALRDDERPRAADLCRHLDGRPLAILQAAALARAGELPLGASGELETAVRERLDDEERRVLHTLELLAPAAVHVDDVAAIARVPDAAAVLERLRERGVAQAHSPRWSATLTLGLTGGEDGEEALLLRRARERLAAAAETRPREDVPAILAALRAGDGGAADRRGVLALARAVDALLARGGRWGAWAAALERALAAAEAGGDRAAAAWALHQLGTRAGCLGDPGGATSLRRALALRRDLGDEAGAAVSAHNLSLLFGALPGGGGQHDGKPPAGPSRTGPWLALGGGVLALGVVAALLLGSSSEPAKPVAAAVSRTQAPVTTAPPGTTVAPTPTPTPRPSGTPGLSIAGKLDYVAPGAGTTDSGTVTVTNLGPGPIALEPSVDNTQFELAPRCPDTLEVGQGCVIAITYRPLDLSPRSASLNFEDTPSSARLDGMVSATSSHRAQPPVVVPEGVTSTETTTTPGPAPSGEEVVVR